MAVPRFLVLGLSVQLAQSSHWKLKPGTAELAVQEPIVETVRPSTLFIGIMSAPEKFDRRQEIRQSWMSHPLLLEASLVAARFVIGAVAPEVELNIAAEREKHRDIVRLDVGEGYWNLTQKSIAFFQWAAEHHPDSRYIMKLDDDTFPHLATLQSMLREREQEFVYAGAIMAGGPVQRRGKWAEDYAMFPEEVYPPYAAGSGYILSLPLVKKLANASRHDRIRRLTNEDTTVGVWVHDFAEANQGWTSVDFFGVPSDVWGCTEGVVLSMQLQPGELSCMWNKLRNRGEPGGGDCCRPLRCYGLHQITDGDVRFWAKRRPPACPLGTHDPAEDIFEALDGVKPLSSVWNLTEENNTEAGVAIEDGSTSEAGTSEEGTSEEGTSEENNTNEWAAF